MKRILDWLLLLIGVQSDLTDEMVAAGVLDFSGQGREMNSGETGK